MATAYIETTIPSYYVARTSDSLLHAAKQAATRRWWVEGCSGFDYLVTLNFKHIANPFIRDRLRFAVANAGFELPVMCSPDELLQNEDEDD
jgi:hypothetical protein